MSGKLITIPARARSWMTVGSGLFILSWIVGWAFAEIATIREIVSSPADAGNLFKIAWLCAWTVGGFFAIWSLRRIVQKPVPETILVNAGGITVDSGIPPFDMFAGWPLRSTAHLVVQLFPKRLVDRLDSRQLASLRLREAKDGNRLTIDVGARRIELARAASDVEREWLFNLLNERFRLEPAVSE